MGEGTNFCTMYDGYNESQFAINDLEINIKIEQLWSGLIIKADWTAFPNLRPIQETQTVFLLRLCHVPGPWKWSDFNNRAAWNQTLKGFHHYKRAPHGASSNGTSNHSKTKHFRCIQNDAPHPTPPHTLKKWCCNKLKPCVQNSFDVLFKIL